VVYCLVTLWSVTICLCVKESIRLVYNNNLCYVRLCEVWFVDSSEISPSTLQLLHIAAVV